MGLKENIKKYRLQNNLTLDDVAKKVGVTLQTIQKYEKGTISNIPQDKIEKLAEIFHITPPELMGWDEGFNYQNVIREITNLNNQIAVNTQKQYELSNTLKELENNEISEERKLKLLERVNKILEDNETEKLRNELLKRFYMLNNKGKEKAIENVDLLTKVPEYKNTKEGE